MGELSELRPIDGNLAPEKQELAHALSELFASLGVSERRYAARHTYHCATVSRYLNGQRPPPWEFVQNLLNDLAEQRDSVPTAQTIELLRSLHNAALRAGGTPSHRTQLLQQQPAEADAKARRAAAHERRLAELLAEREHRIRDLQMRYRELEITVATAEREREESPEDDSEHELTRLRAEVAELREQLATAQRAHRRAEDRCEQLERLLEKAERATAPPEPAADLAVTEAVTELAPDAGPIIHTGEGSTSTIHFNLGEKPWVIDEEYVASVSVQLYGVHGFMGNGLLVGRDRVLTTTGPVLRHTRRGQPPDGWLYIAWDEKHYYGRQVRTMPENLTGVSDDRSSPRQRQEHVEAVLLGLVKPVPGPVPDVQFAQGQSIGDRLLVVAHVTAPAADTRVGVGVRYSALLSVAGRSGGRVRVTGDMPVGILGAPAFDVATGRLVGLVTAHTRGDAPTSPSGLLTPASSALAELLRADGDDTDTGSVP